MTLSIDANAHCKCYMTMIYSVLLDDVGDRETSVPAELSETPSRMLQIAFSCAIWLRGSHHGKSNENVAGSASQNVEIGSGTVDS